MSTQQKTTMEWRNIAELDDDPRNSRTHSAEQIDAIKASIREFGPTSPILTHGNVIKAGHARRQAAQELGLNEFPCVDLSHLTDDQARAYVIADNRLAEKGAGWDYDRLISEFEELEKQGFDATVTGFDEAEIANIVRGFDETQNDNEMPERTLGPEQYLVLVECTSEREQQTVFERITADGYNARIMS